MGVGMSRYAYIIVPPHGTSGVFLSKNKAEEYVRLSLNLEKPSIVYVDRVIRNDPDAACAVRFTPEQFLNEGRYHGKTQPEVKYHLPFKEETYGDY
jgi:hypothetical protein